MPGLNQPALSDLDKYGVQVRNVKDVTWNPLYDYQTYPAAGGTTFTFFQVPIGQSSKTLADTNMRLAGQLSAGEAFLITGVQVELYLAAASLATDDATVEYAEEFYSVMTADAYLQLNVLNKDFVQQGPLIKFLPDQHFEMNSAISTADTTTPATHSSSIMQVIGKTYEIIPIALSANQSFDVSINFSSAVAVTADAKIGVSLRGYRIRSAQ